MAALQYVDVPGYSALLLRRSYADLSRPGALMDRAREWLAGTDANWNEQRKSWRFPSGANLTFGYCETASDVYRYQGAEYQFVGFDELTQFGEREYAYLFSRLRRLAGSRVPLRMRSASNPGGAGHQWVNSRFFIHGPANGRVFVPARLEDNPHLDRDDYRRSLGELDPVTRRQLLLGDWSARDTSNALVPEWTEELAGRVTKDVELPVYFTPYVVGDLGSRDLTVWLFGVWLFEEAKLHVQDELVLKDPSTAVMIAGVQAKEKELWPGLIPGVGEKVRRYSDVDWRLVRDFQTASLQLVPTKKDDALGARNRARAMIAREDVVISPRCRTLLATLATGTWNDKRTDYQRTEGTGHADAWDALVYLIRNVDMRHNPTPYKPPARVGEQVRRPRASSGSAAAHVLSGALKRR